MSNIIIGGRAFVFNGWAICAYEFMEENEHTIDPDLLLIKIMKDSKKLRKKDFLQESSIYLAKYLQNYEQNLIEHSYIPEITSKYIIDFANSDAMQCDLPTINLIIYELQKLINHKNKQIAEVPQIDEDPQIDKVKDYNFIEYISYIENRQKTLIELIYNHI